MTIENSYIFLYKDKTERKKHIKQDGNNIILNFPTSIEVYIQKSFDISRAHENSYSYKNSFDVTLTINNNKFIVVFKTFKVVENTYLNISVNGKTKFQSIKCLEYIHNTLLTSGLENEYITIVSYDSISEYYCNKLYPKLNGLERNLRKLLFNIYIVNFGKDYYEKTIDSSLQDKAKGIIRAKGNRESKREKNLKEFFYSLEFCDIQKLLFTPSWTKYDEEKKNEFLESNNNLSELSDNELRKAFLEFNSKSDWERFFKNKIDDRFDIENSIESVRLYRNNIAHCKFFSKSDYKTCNIILDKLNKTLLSAIAITEEKDFMDKNMESLKRSFSKVSETLLQLSKSITDSLTPIINQIQQITEPFNKTKKLLTQLSLEKECNQDNEINNDLCNSNSEEKENND